MLLESQRGHFRAAAVAACCSCCCCEFDLDVLVVVVVVVVGGAEFWVISFCNEDFIFVGGVISSRDQLNMGEKEKRERELKRKGRRKKKKNGYKLIPWVVCFSVSLFQRQIIINSMFSWREGHYIMKDVDGCL